MFRKLRSVLLFTFCLMISSWGQTPTTPTKLQQKDDEDDVVKITTNLVQVDVTVTDKDGRQVTDLTRDDFEIREEGQLQQITNLSYVGTAPAPSSTEAGKRSNNSETREVPAPPPTRLRADQVARTMAVLVDDDIMSFASLGATHDALKEFIDRQIEPNDLVGIFRTARSNTLLQQFTTDRKQLALAVRRLVWLPGQNNSINMFAAVRSDTETFEDSENERVKGLFEDDVKSFGRERAEYFSSFRSDRPLIVALRFLVNDMHRLPGRKAIMIFTDGLGLNSELQRELRLITDYANRSGIVIHTTDGRALVNPDFIGADETPSEQQRDSIRQVRASSLFRSQGGMSYLAERTGGTFTLNTNDVGKGLRRALEEQRGYYLIGYRPSEVSFRKGVSGFRKLDVTVKRDGLRVRTRSGFISISDEDLIVPERPRTGDSQLYVALVSPIPATDVPLRLTPITGQDERGNSFLRALLHIDAQNINFADEANGWKRMTLDVAAVTLGQNGRVVNEFTRTHTVRIGPDTIELVRQNGVIYSADVPIKSAGAYQFRIVVRDANSKKFGTAGQFIEIPDLKKDALALSGIVLTEVTSGNRGLPPAVPVEAALSPVQSSSDPAVRRFRPGAALSYAHLIYNARSVASTRKPQLTTQVRLFLDSKEIFTGREAAFDVSQQQDTVRLSNDGVVQLSPTASAGEYSLQIIVKDHAAGKSPRVATQWIDFEVVE